MNDKELKPCPFCGSKSVGWLIIYCIIYLLGIMYIVTDVVQKQAIPKIGTRYRKVEQEGNHEQRI